MSKQTLIQGTLLLILASFITKALGFINRIVIARVMGQEGVGLYMMAVPTLLLAITLTRMGLPIAISKLIAEAAAINDRQKIKKILIVSLSITGFLSIVITVGMALAAPILSTFFFTDERVFYPLIAITPVVPIIAISSVLRGYFQGLQNMRPSAYSQVIEQVVRITCVAMLTGFFLQYGVQYAAAGAMLSVILGELASLLYMFSMFKMKKNMKVRKGFFSHLKSSKGTVSELLGIALPTTGSQLIGSLSYFFEPIVAVRSLAIAGVSTIMATRQYGELTGFVIPLLYLPTFITYSLSVSLVPAISEANANKKYGLIEHRLNQAIRLAMLSGGLSAVITFVYAVPLMDMMYDSPSSATFVKMMTPLFFFLYFQGPLQAVLQALDLAKAAMMNSLIGSIVKIGAIFLLATRPEFGIMGVALAIVFGIVVVTLLHFATVVKAISYTIQVKDFLKSVLAIGGAGVISHLFYRYLFPFFSPLQSLCLGLVMTIVCYTILALCLRLIKRSDLKQVPLLKRWV
ncbi:polysaccharide exporter for spore cortex synthesis [Fictibacillus macauensis ZFHKF-1]|uniref:Polysaccharide exporter for spore cortex synthesis n=1 Tax=Fictibacillus macauensis ZFHKF-1 TaxID=1196324 RepID=I8UER2_9BACL|nr:stage V sporulation protein B [Fictibacillus macauensis]EIT85313.1 polysaccharide exporter for spore cortex synthesis [Fictibacillus macauensis ZFHKF-1]